MCVKTKLALAGLGAVAALGSVAISTGGALAADLGGRPRAYEPPSYYEPRVNLERWTGLYLGGTIGYGFGTGGANGDIGGFSFDQDGAAGTLFAGYNWQSGRGVFGLEADIGTSNYGAKVDTDFGTLSSRMNYMGSLRARAGFLATPALLLYATGGFAWANMNIGYDGIEKSSETLYGYQVGLGSEYMVSSNVTLRLEYLYTDLQKETFQFAGQSNTFDNDFHTVRAGIAIKF